MQAMVLEYGKIFNGDKVIANIFSLTNFSRSTESHMTQINMAI